jgi:Uri superfamily endonuclease
LELIILKGAYALLINLDKDEEIKVGSLGTIHFPAGFYLYIGSAMNGIEGRVKRHLRKSKKIHWHIDYLLKNARITKTFYRAGSKGLECSLARQIGNRFLAIPRFGSSDCSCSGHLFFGGKEDLIQLLLKNNMKQLDLRGL